jgi:hypothetical protein
MAFDKLRPTEQWQSAGDESVRADLVEALPFLFP